MLGSNETVEGRDSCRPDGILFDSKGRTANANGDDMVKIDGTFEAVILDVGST